MVWPRTTAEVVAFDWADHSSLQYTTTFLPTQCQSMTRVLLESQSGPVTEKLCRDYLSLSDQDARRIDIPQFEQAAQILLAINPSETKVNELFKHRLKVVSRRAILFCIAHNQQAWANRIVERLMPMLAPQNTNDSS